MKTATERKFNFFGSCELQFEMLISFFGKGKVIKELMWLRSSGENKNIRDAYKGIEVKTRIDDWWAFNKQERIEFIKVMSDAFRVADPDINTTDYDDIVTHGYNSYVKGLKITHKRISKFKSLILNFIMNLTSVKFRNFIRTFRNTRRLTFLEEAKRERNKGLKIDYGNLVEVQEIISNFHKK